MLTGQAANLRVRAVQIDDAATARLGVQEVDILGDHAGDAPGALERGQGAMTDVGAGSVHMPPAHVVACPVAAPEHRVSDELLDRHRVTRRRIRSAVVRNAGVGGDAGAGEHGDPSAVHQGPQGVEGRSNVDHPFYGRPSLPTGERGSSARTASIVSASAGDLSGR